MKVNPQIYKNLRPFKHLSFFGIINHIFCNRIMTSKLLVSAAPTLYQAARKFPGKTITHFVINSTFCRLFTGGNKLSDLQRYNRHLSQRGIPTIIDFCAEGTRDQLNSQKLLDQNANLFTKSAQQAVLIPNQLISIKITALINLDLLEKYNRSILLRDRIWRQYSVDGKLNAQSLFDALQKLYLGLSTQDIRNYAKEIYSFKGENISQFQLDQITFKMNHHPYYMYQPNKNDLLVMKLLFPLDNSQKAQISNMKQRLSQILDKQFNNANNLRILVDAEQTYVQRAIESISEQLQQKYNKQRPYIIVTLQNYLKQSQSRVDYQLTIAEKKKINIGIKLVRGAYLVQETKLCKKNGTQTQIVGTFQETTNNYLRNFQKLVTSDLNGQIFAATHNEETIRALLEIKSKKSNSIKVNFAQLCGIGDHLTYYLKSKNENVYKLFPWAEAEVMVGYLIRRAEELSQMNYPLDIQYKLLKSQLYNRTISI